MKDDEMHQAHGAAHGEALDRLLEESIQAFYQGRPADGRLACDRLLNLVEDPAVRARTRLNQVHYTPLLTDVAPGLVERRLEPPVRDGWSSFNPAVEADGDGWLVLVRSSNYRIEPPGRYIFTDGHAIRTRYFLVRLDASLREVGEPLAVADRTDPARKLGGPVQDFEDCRLVRIGDRLLATATTREHAPGSVAQIALLDLEADGPQPALTNLRLLSPGWPNLDEKNWMPFWADGELRLVYLLGPTIVLTCDPAEGRVRLDRLHHAPRALHDLRGGSQLVRMDAGWLCISHEITWWENGERVYLHRFVTLDDSLRVSGYSHPFRFQRTGIEFVAGLACRDNTLAVTFGVGDTEAWIATLPVAEALALVRPLAELLDGASVVTSPVPAGLAAILGAAECPGDGAPSAATSVGQSASTDIGATVGDVAASATASVGQAAVARANGPAVSLARPWLVSVTMAGDSEAIIGDALRSVAGFVDACLLLDTGITDRTIEVAREVVGERLIVRSFPWIDDFAAARNAGLAAAAQLGATWAMILDTDERIRAQPADVRAILATAPVDGLLAWHESGSYRKERFFRLPAHGRYVGPTHEAFIATSATGAIDGLVFSELPKTEEAYRRKFERDAAILAAHTAANPDDPRWWYYLADTLENLGRHREAIAAFERCHALDGWDEEAAWAMYRAGCSWLSLDEPRRAEEAASAGFARHAGMPELAWLAAYAAWRAGRFRQAVRWGRLSAEMGLAFGRGPTGAEERHGFRHPPALWEGPWDVLRHALRALGDTAGAEEAERRFAVALELRTLHEHAARPSPMPVGTPAHAPASAGGAE